MNSDRLILTVAMIAIVLASVGSLAVADPTSPESLSQQSSERKIFGGTQTIGAQGGNVTEVNIEALTVTTSWQGYYGDISGEITLDDANNNTFYNWTVTTVSGEVYASRIGSIDWSNVNCTNSTNITSEETYLGQVASDGDSVSNTFSLTTHPAFSAGTSDILADTCSSTNGFVANATQSENWSMVMLYDFGSAEEGVIYSALINETVQGFDGANHDFQILVGENEKTGQTGSTDYYFWVELE